MPTSPHAWAIRIDASRAAAAASLRLRSGIEACEAGESVWLRGPDGGEELALELKRLPGAERYEVLPGGLVREEGKRVPAGKLPDGPWTSAAAWSGPAAQEASLPAELTQRVKPRLERTGRERPANVLRLSRAAFVGWAETAATVRLRPLAFAASGEEVVVRGEPLPPVKGLTYAEEGGLAVPCGWALIPEAGTAAWRERLALAEGDVALFNTDGSFERVPAAAFVRASRSAARATAGHA